MKKTPDQFEGIDFPSSILYNLGSGKIVEPKIRNEHTDGKFVTYSEYDRIIRRKKLEKININNEKNS